MKVIVGLGNPGKEYERTRHNVGWWVVDHLADVWHFDGWRKDGDARVSNGMLGNAKVRLVKPQTYMNLSGNVLRPYVRRPFWTPAKDLMIAVDEVAPEDEGLRETVRARLGAFGQAARYLCGRRGARLAVACSHLVFEELRAESTEHYVRGAASPRRRRQAVRQGAHGNNNVFYGFGSCSLRGWTPAGNKGCGEGNCSASGEQTQTFHEGGSVYWGEATTVQFRSGMPACGRPG